jgi:hypothetical protein
MEVLPSEVDRNDTPSFPGEGGEHGVGEIEVLLGGVAPSSRGPAGAEVGGRDGDGLAVPVAPFGPLPVAGELVACSTGPAFIEQRRTQSRG